MGAYKLRYHYHSKRATTIHEHNNNNSIVNMYDTLENMIFLTKFHGTKEISNFVIRLEQQKIQHTHLSSTTPRAGVR